jgi:hypothetical protein
MDEDAASEQNSSITDREHRTMGKKESKIPLVVAAIFLAYLVYWGVGYARSHQSAPVQPVAQATPPPAQQPAAAQPGLVASQGAMPDQQAANMMTKHAAAAPPPDPYETTEDGSNPQQNADYMQNRKLAGITDAAGKKH